MEEKTEVAGIYKVSDGILINKDNDALAAYKAAKARNKRLTDLESQISELRENDKSIKNDLDEIKNLLKGLAK
jgi:hypothetical protein